MSSKKKWFEYVGLKPGSYKTQIGNCMILARWLHSNRSLSFYIRYMPFLSGAKMYSTMTDYKNITKKERQQINSLKRSAKIAY